MRTLSVLLFLLPQNKPETIYYLNPTIQESRTKIAIIDTGISINETTKPYLCNGNHYDLTGFGIEDKISHGMNIAGIVAKQIDTQKNCLLIIKYFHTQGTSFNTIKAFKIAKEEKVKFVNYSSGGSGDSLSEKDAIKSLLNNKIYVIVASGNFGNNLSKTTCDYFPACYNFDNSYFKVVGNGQSEDKRHTTSNYGKVVTDWRNGQRVEGFGVTMSGSSQATAILTGELVAQ